MLITAVEPRRKSLSALFIDGEFAVNIDTETLLKSGFRAGREISDEQLHELIQNSDSRRAGEKALYLLEHRSHSQKELADKISRVASREAAEAAAQHMADIGLVNDEDYGRRLAADLLCRKGYSASRTRRELEQKGIDRELAEQIIEETAPDPVQKIQEIIRRKYGLLPQDEKGRRRSIAALQRLGYHWDDIRTAINEMENEDE
ncbi:regulatory protein RecX [Caproiciproducens galactitolivorans]|uniref:Regulatory protein RecX n=1 Tax=Caproiciproducens galactitolivorans TaxID=642589 RepID=A0ABT4BSG0_9FIRM|nr:regulatory protein RecX [Caproiciproducens galactitolivorans]MCY1713838.1 regulatory protein RecX [Caproiciproducens galactitolivorans]